MTYTVSRDGRTLGTFSEEGLSRHLDNGTILPADLVFLENEQRWVAIAGLPKGEAEQNFEFEQRLEVATPSAFVTPALIAINVMVFIAMAICGVSLVQPQTRDLVRWGADFGPLVAQGQWWRLLTAAFVHVGFLHIALNMWALLNAGIYAERLFGNRGFLTVYLLSAIGGNLASIATKPLLVSAGASGAIFGVFGALIALLLAQHKSILTATATPLARSALAFVWYNILFGATQSNIDLTAHFGGLLTGLIVGGALAYRVDAAQGGAGRRRNLAVALVASLLFVVAGSKLRGGDARQTEAFNAELDGKSLTIGQGPHCLLG